MIFIIIYDVRVDIVTSCIVNVLILVIQWNPSILDTFGTNISVLIRGVPSFQGVNLLKSTVWDICKCP